MKGGGISGRVRVGAYNFDSLGVGSQAYGIVLRLVRPPAKLHIPQCTLSETYASLEYKTLCTCMRHVPVLVYNPTIFTLQHNLIPLLLAP
jgi:hypothetical protein